MKWSHIFKRIYAKFRWKSTYSKNLATNDPNMNVKDNVYCSGNKLHEFVKEQNIIHKIFKYRLVYPLLLLGTRILGRYLVKSVPDKPQFKELRVFDKAFNSTINDWISCYLYNTKDRSNNINIIDFKNNYKRNELIKLLMTLKEFYLTIVKNDTAYLELHNMLMFNLTKSMNDTHDSRVAHLLYTHASIKDVRYFILKDKLKIQDVTNAKNK